MEVCALIALDWATCSKAVVLIMVKNYRGTVRYENKNLTWKYKCKIREINDKRHVTEFLWSSYIENTRDDN